MLIARAASVLKSSLIVHSGPITIWRYEEGKMLIINMQSVD